MAVQVKAHVSYSEKMGTPNYGSIGASCGIEIEITQEDLADGRLQEEIRMGFDACRRAVQLELNRQQEADAPPPPQKQLPAPQPTPQEQEAVDSVYAACQTPKDMASLLKQWSQAKPVGTNPAKWTELIEEAKQYVNRKIMQGEWTDYDCVVGVIKNLGDQIETANQGALAF